MISMKKSIVGAEQGKILGHQWQAEGYFIADEKKLKALLMLPHHKMSTIPAHSTYGLLNLFRYYFPDFATRTKPIHKLLGKVHSQWGDDYTTCVWDTVKAITEALPVLNFEPSMLVKLQYRIGSVGMAGVLL